MAPSVLELSLRQNRQGSPARPSHCPLGTGASKAQEHQAYPSAECVSSRSGRSSDSKKLRKCERLKVSSSSLQPLPGQRPRKPSMQMRLLALQATPAPCLTLETRGALQPPGSCTRIQARMATRQRPPHTTVRAIPPLFNMHRQQCRKRGPALSTASKVTMRLASQPKIIPNILDAQSHCCQATPMRDSPPRAKGLHHMHPRQ